jgi:CRISPR system Cascade subunit CasE
MTWLARLDVDIQRVYAERFVDSYAWHKCIWRDCFASDPDAKREFLTRLERGERSYRVWILSGREPKQPRWCTPQNFAVKPIGDAFLSHQYYAFDLIANPTKCLNPTTSDGQRILRNNSKRTKGKRVAIVRPEELRNWLVRKSQIRALDEKTGVEIPGGFRIVDGKSLDVSPMVENHFRKGEHAAYHGAVRFRGVLEVIDREQFAATYQKGIGSGKAFGFGLLLIAPVTAPTIASNS